MGMCASKPWQISLNDILEKIRCYSACCGGQVIVEHDEFDGEEFTEGDNHEDLESVKSSKQTLDIV